MFNSPPIDLTLSLADGQRGVAFETARSVEKDGWNARTLPLYSHCGTHMDSPLHFGVSEQTIDEFPLSDCMGKAWVVRIAGDCTRRLLTVSDLGGVAETLQPGDSLLLQTGWSHFVNEDKYRDALPRISEELAKWCVDKGVKILGVEPPSVADVHNLEEVTRIHRILLSGGVIIVEGLTHLELLKGPTVYFMALPLKVVNGDGAPVRALAFEFDD